MSLSVLHYPEKCELDEVNLNYILNDRRQRFKKRISKLKRCQRFQLADNFLLLRFCGLQEVQEMKTKTAAAVHATAELCCC